MEGVPGDVVGVCAELKAGGQQEAPLAAGQQQLFQIEPHLQRSPQAAPYIEWFVQQRGYVAELFRREQEVIQRQLAEMHQQQLDFMQQQGHLVRDILAALTAAEQNRKNRDGDRARHEENDNKASEVSFGVSGQDLEDNKARCGAGLQKAEHLATSPSETTLNTGCQLVSPSTFGPGTAADALKADFIISVPAASRTLEFQCTETFAPVLAGLEWNLNKLKLNPYAHLYQTPGTMVSLVTSQQLTQSTLAGPQCTFGCLDDVKGLCRKVIFRDALTEQKVQAGRNTNTQALNVDLKAFGSTPNQFIVGGAPPAEVKFERIRTKLEFEPPPSSPATLAQANEPDRIDSRSWKCPPLELVCVKRRFVSKRNWEPGAERDCVSIVMITGRTRSRANRIHGRADWDPGPDAAVMPTMLVAIWPEPWSLTKPESCATTPTFWEASQQPGSLAQSTTTGVMRHPPTQLPVGSAFPLSTSMSPQQSTSTGSGRAPSVQVPCWSSGEDRRSGPTRTSYIKWGDIVTTGNVNVPTVHSPLDSNSAPMSSLDCR